MPENFFLEFLSTKPLHLRTSQCQDNSGKTSIALHRVAYLLYKYRDRISSENIMIISPNYLFSDYISNVLPELGESNMGQLTFGEYAEKYFKDKQIKLF